jgi:hypothetical protein
MIAKLLPAGPVPSAHADTLLEIAALMTAVDGHLADAELAAFAEIATRVRGRATSPADSASFLKGLSTDPAAIASRVRSIAPSLPADLRETAFKLAIGLALVDDDASPLEDELVGVLYESLELDPARAESLAAEVRSAFQAP